jgi:hypothetical protein
MATLMNYQPSTWKLFTINTCKEDIFQRYASIMSKIKLYFARVADARQHIADEVLKEATNNIGMGMTYTLFEWVKENLDQLVASQPEKLAEAITSKLVISEPTVIIFVLVSSLY